MGTGGRPCSDSEGGDGHGISHALTPQTRAARPKLTLIKDV